MHRRAVIAALLTALWVPAALASDDAEVLGRGRVVLVPPNLGVRAATEVEAGVEPVWREILQHFAAAQKNHPTALERNSAAALWREVALEVKANPNADVYDAYALFARRIADQVEYSAIVFPSLVTRAARLSGNTASWDGVRRRVSGGPGDGSNYTPVMGSGMVVTGVRGEIAAASLHVAVLSPDGELRFEGAGGLALLQQIQPSEESSEVDLAMRENAFSDAAELREGVEAAFRRPLPASRAH
jgi:hypothetical protein